MKRTILLVMGLVFLTLLVGCETDSNTGLTNVDYEKRISSLEDEKTIIVEEYESRLFQLEKDNIELVESYNDLVTSLETLESNNIIISKELTDLVNTLDDLDFDALSDQILGIQNLDISKLDSLLDIKDQLLLSLDDIQDIKTSITNILDYDLDDIELINGYIQDINQTLNTLNNTITLLTGTGGVNDTDEILEDLEKILLDIDIKLNSLRGFDIEISNYSLHDDVVKQLIYSLKDTYYNELPNDSATPARSSSPSMCTTLTYEVCQTNESQPALYSQQYDLMLKQIEYVNELTVYIDSFENFINAFSGYQIPVFPEEIDVYDDGKILYSSRTSKSALYELQYMTSINDEDKRIDAKVEVLYEDSNVYKVILTLDVKSSLLGLYYTDNTYEFVFYFEEASLEPIFVSVNETNYPVNQSILFRKLNDVNSISYYHYEESMFKDSIYMSFDDDYSIIYTERESYNPEIVEIEKEEIYTSEDGLFLKEDNNYSQDDFIPLKWFENWKKVYYREDGELTKIKISKVILDDNSDIIISDEELGSHYSKIYMQDFIYYDNYGNKVELDNYLIVGKYYSSILTENLSSTAYFDSTYSSLNASDIDEFYLDEIDPDFDVKEYSFGENIMIEKTKEEVYEDSIRLLEFAKANYPSSSNVYYSNLDKFLVGFDEQYYDLSKTYIYYPNSYGRVYLYANKIGDYEFIGKNPLDFTKEEVSINP